MRLVSADSSTGQFPDPPGDDGAGGDGSTTRMLVKPVFTRGSDRRRRLLVRGGYLAAASCVAYLAMVLVSVFASPSARPAASADAGAAPTTVQQVTPARPSKTPAPAVVRARPVVPAPVTRPPVPVSATPTVPASASVAPTASAKPTKKVKASKTVAPKPTAPAAPAAPVVP